jgi:hypothetical protein
LERTTDREERLDFITFGQFPICSGCNFVSKSLTLNFIVRQIALKTFDETQKSENIHRSCSKKMVSIPEKG